MVPNILVIDDDEIIQNVLGRVLRKEGYNVIVAKDGKDGLNNFSSFKYDLVITDLMMPYANGFEIVSRIKEHPNTQNAAIIVISGITQEDSILDSYKLGADEYMRKPIIIPELLHRVKKLLAQSKTNPDV